MKKYYKKKYYKKMSPASILIVMLFLFIPLVVEHYKSSQSIDSSTVQFSKCTDGDTAHFIVDGEEVTVRFLAIDTPETVKPGTPIQPYGKEASNRTCELITNAKAIRLEYEDNNKKDKYGRLLAWVFADGILIQEDLISKGYAKVAYLYGNYKYTSKLQTAESKAKENELGIWN